MHLQFLLDNTRTTQTLDERCTNHLAAELIHSTLFHKTIIYLDAYLVNNPFFIQASRHHSVIQDIFHLDDTHIALIDKNKSLLDNLEYLVSNNIFHPSFKNAELLGKTENIIRQICGNTNLIRYNINNYREEFTKSITGTFSSDLAATETGLPKELLAEAITHIINEKSDTQHDKTLGQSDFEHANRQYAPFESYLLKKIPTLDIKKIRTPVFKLERYCYRNARAKALDSSIIMHPEHRAIDVYDKPHKTVLDGTRTSIESRWFHVNNLTNIDIETIVKIRESEEFSKYNYYTTNKDALSIPEHIERLRINTKNYIEYIDRIIKESLPAERRIDIQGHNILIDFLIRTSRIAQNIAEIDLFSESDLTKSAAELSVQIADTASLLPSGIPIGETVTEFAAQLYRLPILSPFLSAKSEMTASNIQHELDKRHGESITAFTSPLVNTTY
ncbi:MAG: hypothetical protein ACOZEN_05270 [Thermodesulfobacteriota bacterium]